MKVEQAIYGEVRSGHGLRGSSDHSRIVTELVSRVDLPDTAPPGVQWSPFVSGFPHGDRYVLARTFIDTTATRAGMVLSHVVIAPLVELAKFADLRPLLALLASTPELPDALQSCEVPESTKAPPTTPDLLPAAEALTSRGAGPAVRIGIQGFEDLAAALWFHLWPELRIRFAFRLSFGPHDLVETPQPSLICTPSALAVRWSGHRIIGSSGATPLSRVASILSGGVEAAPVLSFAREIGAQLDGFADLPLLEKAYEIEATASPSLDDCVTVLRLVERLSPDPDRGTAGKARLIQRLVSQLQAAPATRVLLLRNLSTTGLPAVTTLWKGLESWVTANEFVQSDDPAMLSVMENALSASAAVDPWRSAVLAGVVTAARSTASTFSIAFWRWAETRPATLADLAHHLPQSPDVEVRLTEAAPRQISVEAGKVVMAIALAKRWLRLHGAAAGASLPSKEAVRRQLSVDVDPGSLDGLKAALRAVSPAESVAIALETAESRVLRIAAEVVAQKPQLLNDLDFTTAPAQQLWAYTIALNAEAWRGPADPVRSFTSVIQNLLDGGPASTELITTLSLTPVADLSGFGSRAEVWPRLPNPARGNLLKATATGWLDRASTGDVAYAPDPELEAAILAGNRLDGVLCTLAPTGVATVARIVTALPGFDEPRFYRWVGCWAERRQRLLSPDAEALGRVILDRRWRLVLDELVHLALTRWDDLKPALRACHDMIGIFTRWRLGFSPPSDEDRWKILEHLVTDLYPNGPDDNEIWVRAGGREADLQSSGSGSSRWRDAIAQMRRGKGPRLVQLLGEVRRDFPSNEQVRYLTSDVEARERKDREFFD